MKGRGNDFDGRAFCTLERVTSKSVKGSAVGSMVYDGKQGDIINQFVRFTKVFDEQRKIQDDPRKAVEETIRICKGEDVLKDYLEREEAAVVVFTFADQEKATRLTMEEERREGENKLGALMKKMKDDGRVDDAFQAATDVAFREKMYKAYGMA